MLLTRDQFREQVQNRDKHRCVVCGREALNGVKLDSHHIMERRLWTAEHEEGGYFLDNGATLCDTDYAKPYSCHLKAGMTLISPDQIRSAAGIKTVILPEHLYADQPYTVWGDTVLPNGRRMKGELFFDESVQFMLKLGSVLNLYTDYVRHPRTYHLPFSGKVVDGDIGDDKVMKDLSRFQGQRVIVTAKMDGGQFTVYKDYLHARTTDFKSDVTSHWLQNFVKLWSYEMPDGYRINIENLWGNCCTAIQYQNLPSYCMAWMMWDDKNYCLSWDETLEWFQLLGNLPHPKVLYDGIWDEDKIRSLYVPTLDGDPLEGFVVRLAERFHYKEFRHCVGKYVRTGHQVRHNGDLIRNSLRK